MSPCVYWPAVADIALKLEADTVLILCHGMPENVLRRKVPLKILLLMPLSTCWFLSTVAIVEGPRAHTHEQKNPAREKAYPTGKATKLYYNCGQRRYEDCVDSMVTTE